MLIRIDETMNAIKKDTIGWRHRLYIGFILLFSITATHAVAKDTTTMVKEESFVSEKQDTQDAKEAALKQKIEYFKTLDEMNKISYFRRMDKNSQMDFFVRLEKVDQVLIFEHANREEREKWQKAISDFKQADTKPLHPTVPPKKKPQPLLEEAPLSRIERILSGEFPTEISHKLRQYGYNFFANGVTTDVISDELHENVPVDDNYVIGPGDQFSIYLWGKVEKTYPVKVFRDGNIMIPRLGSIQVSGLRYHELKQLLDQRFREYYPEFEMIITMDRLRSIHIYVVGEAKNPGSYTVSTLSTIISALNEAGGPTKNGSLRGIKVFRRGNTVKHFDLYTFFVQGKQIDNIRLMDGDTIFIPVIGPVVGVAGNARRPAIYELAAGETIGDVIDMAGGVLPTGHLQNVVVERIVAHQRRIIKSFNLSQIHAALPNELSMPLKDGDVIKVYPVHTQIRQVVYLEGHVKYPRAYELKNDMRLNNLIHSYDDLLPEPFLPRAEIIRLIPPDLHPEIIAFDLGAFLSGEKHQNLRLHDLDRIIIYAREDKTRKPVVTIHGLVNTPGTYPLLRGMTVRDVIFKAGNFKEGAYLENATLSRTLPTPTGTHTVKIDFSPAKALMDGEEDNLELQSNDAIYIREIPQYSQALERKVYLEGEFVFPGEYTFSEGERLYSVIERAGGMTAEAYPFGAVFQRESIKEIQRLRLEEYVSKVEEDILTLSAQSAETALSNEQAAIIQQTLTTKKQLLAKMKAAKPAGRMVIDLVEVLHVPGSNNNFVLQPEDRLIVGKRPDYVNVIGEVYNPTALFALQGKPVGYYLNQVGGMMDSADKKQTYLVKANGVVISKSQEGFFGIAMWDAGKQRWESGGFNSLDVNPGDTIIVPKKVEIYPWLRVTKDVTQILYQIAIAAGVAYSIAF